MPRLIYPPLADATAAVAAGDLTKSLSIQTQTVNYDSKDEMGDLGRAFNAMITRLQGVGTNFAGMTANLRDLVGQVAKNAENLGAASGQLAASAQESGQAAGQIAGTIQEITKGITQQSESVTHTASDRGTDGPLHRRSGQGRPEPGQRRVQGLQRHQPVIEGDPGRLGNLPRTTPKAQPNR